MKTTIPTFLVVLVSLFNFCDPLNAQEPKAELLDARLNDRKWREALVGNWRGVASYPDNVVDCVVSYRADGTSTGEGTMTTNGITTKVNWSQTWRVENGHLHWIITKSNIPEIWPENFSSSDKIVDVTADEFTYVTKDGGRMVERRVKNEKEAEQAGTGQPATRPESKSEGGDKHQPQAEGRSR